MKFNIYFAITLNLLSFALSSPTGSRQTLDINDSQTYVSADMNREPPQLTIEDEFPKNITLDDQRRESPSEDILNGEQESQVPIRPPKEGDLPFYSLEASGHQQAGDGIPLNEFDQVEIGQILGLPDVATLQQRLDEVGAFNPRQNDEQKKAGTFLALNTAAKLKTLPAETLETEENAMRVYGQLKVQGLAGDGAAIRETLVENGGDPGDLTDQQLVDLWGANEHQNLHAVLFGNPRVSRAVHMTSLSDNNGQNPEETQLGGFNDKGEFPEWGWFEAAKELPSLLKI